MPRKSLSYASGCAEFLILAVLSAGTAFGADSDVATNSAPKYLGATTCASSGCHGGGGQHQNQFYIWSLRDFHSQRPVATLTTARSKQIGETLQIKDPAADARCTTCHAPLQDVPTIHRGSAFKVSEGVSCESCHGPAENWLRAHTRKDWTRADRTAAGMRDLKNLYVRANTCVACLQTVTAPLLAAGHPELIFELDGQSVAQPKHWRESTNWSGAQAWFIGQVAALREMSWQLGQEAKADERLVVRWRALLWLMQKVSDCDPALPKLDSVNMEVNAANFDEAQKACDKLAQAAAKQEWKSEVSRRALQLLASASEDFRKPVEGVQTQARRAERLVLALDRLKKPGGKAEKELNRLFALAQSIPDFNSADFAEALAQFNTAAAE